MADYEPPAEILALDTRERAFVEGVILDGLSMAESCRRAGYSENYQTRLRRRPKIRAALLALRIPDSDRLIASVAQIREAMSAIALDEEAKATDRTAAANLLLKVEGALGPETFVDARVQTVTYQVGAGSPTALLDVLDVMRRLAAGEVPTQAEAAEALAVYLASGPDQKVLDAGSDGC